MPVWPFNVRLNCNEHNQVDSYQIPWWWPWCEHLSKMKIFWKHLAIFLPHAFATKFIMNSNKNLLLPSIKKNNCMLIFLGQAEATTRAVGCTRKKSILIKNFELIKLLSIAETLLLLTTAWKIKCSGALASLGTGVLGGEAEERF